MGVLESLGQRVFAVSSDLGRGVDVREVGSDAWGIDDIVQGEMGDQIRLLQQQRQGLTDTASSTANNDCLEGERVLVSWLFVYVWVVLADTCRCKWMMQLIIRIFGLF